MESAQLATMDFKGGSSEIVLWLRLRLWLAIICNSTTEITDASQPL